MTEKRRNQILILVSLALIITLPYLRPKIEQGPWDWDWRAVELGPTDTVRSAGADDVVSVRILPTPTAEWIDELLAGVGQLDVAVGPASAHRSEVWVLGRDADCQLAVAAAEHVAAGGALVTWSSCDELAGPTMRPNATAWESPAAVASVGRLRDLALPPSGLEWPPDESGASLVARRAGGGAVLMQSDRVAVFGFDLDGFLLELRQGQTDLAGIDTDGRPGLTAADLLPFPWASPTWRTPSADAWADVLAAAIDAVRGEPLPRLWPLPTEAVSAVVLSLDPEAAALDPILLRAQASGGELTVLASPHAAPIASAQRRIERWGHGLGVLSDARGVVSPQEIEAIVRADVALAPLGRAVGNRGQRWWGSDGPPRLYAELGVWVELDRAGGVARSGPGFRFGGRGHRAWSTSGPLPVLSLPVQVDDRAMEPLGPERAALSISNLIEAAATHRVPVTARLHGDRITADATVLDALLRSAAGAGLPVMSAERYAAWAWTRRRRLSNEPGSPGVPLLRWEPGAACDAPLPADAFGPVGCLVPAD